MVQVFAVGLPEVLLCSEVLLPFGLNWAALLPA